MPDGQTATNPNTGEKVVMRGGQWVPLGGGAPSAPRIFQAPQKPGANVDLARDEVGLQRDRQALDIAAAAEARARQDQILQERKYALDAEKAQREREKLAKSGGVDASVEQGKAGSFALRAAEANKAYTGAALDPDSMIGTTAAGLFPKITAFASSDERNAVRSAEREFIGAVLRYDSGAAIPDSEFDNAYQTYFPSSSAGPREIEQKRRARETALQGLQLGAGPAAGPSQAVTSVAKDGLSGLVDAVVDDGIGLSVDVTAETRRPGETDEQFAARSAALEATDARQAIEDRKLLYGTRDTTTGELDAAVRGIADTATLGLADEISAAGDTIFNGGTMQENLRRQRGIDRADEQVNPVARIGGQIVGGFALPVGAETGAAALARTGAFYGAGYGFGSGEGSVSDRLISAGQGGTVGAVTGMGLGAVSNRLTRGGGGGNGGGRATDLIAAANRQGVDMLPADVGGATTRRFTAGVSQTPFGAGAVTGAAQARDGRVAARIGEIAAAEGTPVRQEVLGDTVRGAAERYIANSAEEGRALYNNARSIAADATITPERAVSNIDAQLGELAQTANTDAPLINGLNRLRDDLASEAGPNNISIDAIRRLRTSTRNEAQVEGLRGTDYQRRAGLVLDDLAEDIAAQLAPDAAQAFRQADAAWAERLDVIDNTMSQILGPRGDRSSEAITNRLGQMARGDSARLRTFVDNLSPEEAGIVRGSLISDLGRAASGQQNAAGSEFSLQGFLTAWDKLPDRTRNILFRGESRAAIEDLARVAEGARGTARYSNTSNTAGASNAATVLSSLGAFTTLGMSAAAEHLTGRLLASPNFARWLARPPRDPRRALSRLGQIAAREPALAPEIAPIQQALQQSMGSTTTRAAAQPEQNNRERQ